MYSFLDVITYVMYNQYYDSKLCNVIFLDMVGYTYLSHKLNVFTKIMNVIRYIYITYTVGLSRL